MNAALVAEILGEELMALGVCAVLTALLFGGWKLWRRAREGHGPAGLIAALLLAGLVIGGALYFFQPSM